ncbi:MAG: HAD family phosphatase [bacterium]|nr:HAD family phosphatase [bacterium]
MKNIKAIFFDLDGLLINTDELIYGAIIRILKDHNKSMDPDEFGSFFGLSGEDLAKRIVNDCDIQLSHKELIDLIRAEANYPSAQLKTGARELLEYLEPKYELVLVTNAAEISLSTKMSHLGVADFFSKIIALGDQGRPKPAPDCYLKAIEATGNKPMDCLILEDSEIGVTAGLAAGCQVVFIPNKYIADPQDIARKNKVSVYSSLGELPGIL